MGFVFFFNSILLGVGLAMDAFSVSLANGLNEPGMRKKKLLAIAGTFGFFQALMPMIGWACVHTVVHYFKWFERLIPWIALALLSYIGIKMLADGLRKGGEGTQAKGLTRSGLIIQGIATSIDALSVGFTIEKYDIIQAVTAAVIIAVVTFVICVIGLKIGRKFGTKLENKASILGGVILIAIGIEIFISGII